MTSDDTLDFQINNFIEDNWILLVVGLVVGLIVLYVLIRRFDLVADAGNLLWSRVAKPIGKWVIRQAWLVIIFSLIVIMGSGYLFYDGDPLGLLRGIGVLPPSS